MTEPIILIQSVKRGGDPMALQRTLHETLPGFIIMYGADISSIRQLEVNEVIFFKKNNAVLIKKKILKGLSKQQPVNCIENFLPRLRRVC